MADDGKRALAAAVASSGILASHVQGEIGDGFHDFRSATSLLGKTKRCKEVASVVFLNATGSTSARVAQHARAGNGQWAS